MSQSSNQHGKMSKDIDALMQQSVQATLKTKGVQAYSAIVTGDSISRVVHESFVA